MEIGIRAVTAPGFSWLGGVVQPGPLNAASLSVPIAWSWHIGLCFMRNGAGLGYFIICFILSGFIKTQVTFSPPRYLLCAVTMELFNQPVLWRCVGVTWFFHHMPFSKRDWPGEGDLQVGASIFYTCVRLWASLSSVCFYNSLSAGLPTLKGITGQTRLSLNLTEYLSSFLSPLQE